ncbi:unnamed protein product [Closterium sp. Naga37s-1]|nr:unnamed protein product [Closterium sp. Naga37s-1]
MAGFATVPPREAKTLLDASHTFLDVRLLLPPVLSSICPPRPSSRALFPRPSPRVLFLRPLPALSRATHARFRGCIAPTEEEFAASHVEGAVNVAVMTGDPHKGASEKRSDFLDDVKSKFQPDTPLVVSCWAGRRAAVAAEELVEAGFTKVVSLEGGLKAWKGEGYPLVE